MENQRSTATRNDNSAFASRFAFYGSIGSISSIALIALVCRVGSLHHDLGTFMPAKPMLYRPSNNIDGIHRRRLENADQPDVDTNMACGDIFLNVIKRTSNDTQGVLNFNHTNSSNNNSNERGDESYSYNRRICQYAQACDGGFISRTFLPLILCHGVDISHTQLSKNENSKNNNNLLQHIYSKSIFIYMILPSILLLYLFLLFRLLATTADSYFSPALESFSFELGLPPRFAGATLLALGNGSPDLGSTVNSILLWNEATANLAEDPDANVQQAWTMSLGSLTGGGMFVGTIVCGLLIQTCSGIPCRRAFVRDVSMYALSVCVVWYTLESGSVTSRDIKLFLGMYLAYVIVILCADMYHRKVTLPRLHDEGIKRQKSLKESLRRLSVLSDGIEENDDTADETTPLMGYGGERIEQLKEGDRETRKGGAGISADIGDMTTSDSSSSGNYISTLSGNKIPSHPKLRVADRFAMLMSNYDPNSVKFDRFEQSSRTSSGSGDSSELQAITALIRNIQPGIRSSPGNRLSLILETDGQHVMQPHLESLSEQPESSSVIADPSEIREWSVGMFIDAYDELKFCYHQYIKTCFENETSFLGKLGLVLELPFVAVRTVTIPVPCEEHYSRPILALSVALSPYWVLWYISSLALPAVAYCILSLITSLCILRHADDDKLPIIALVPISLYGFFIAATWIDTIADSLVELLQFLGTISRIPSTILGLTVLAWGNSMGDLSANLAMARKGMPDMATTGCFAGPSFNLLVGTGLGFLYLQYELNRPSISPVSLTPTIRIAFVFIIVNCMSIIFCGICFKGRLPQRYSILLFILYLLFIAVSIATMFHWS